MRFRVTMLLASAAFLSACGKKDAAEDKVDSAKDAGAVVDTTTKATTPALTDANILAREKAGDSSEVVIAGTAKTKAKDAGVKSFAQRLVTDHSKGGKEVEALATKLAITPQPASDDTTAVATSHALDHLNSLKGADFDTAFVNHEVEDHKQDIADVNKAIAATSNADLKALLQKSLPTLQTHLDMAQKLADRLSAKK